MYRPYLHHLYSKRIEMNTEERLAKIEAREAKLEARLATKPIGQWFIRATNAYWEFVGRVSAYFTRALRRVRSANPFVAIAQLTFFFVAGFVIVTPLYFLIGPLVQIVLVIIAVVWTCLSAAFGWHRPSVLQFAKDIHQVLPASNEKNEGDREGAIELLEQAILAHPESAQAFCDLGGLKVDTGHFDEGIGLIRNAIQIEPQNPEFYYVLGRHLFVNHRYPDSRDAFRKGVTLGTTRKDATFYLGWALKECGEMAEAEPWLEKGAPHAANIAEAHYIHATVCVALEQWRRAKVALSDAIQANPRHERAIYDLGCLYAALEEMYPAVAQYKALKSIDSNLADALAEGICRYIPDADKLIRRSGQKIKKPPRRNLPDSIKWTETREEAGSTFECYAAPNPIIAKKFLKSIRVSKPFYYLVVETPGGTWGRDVDGLYLERLQSFQKSLEIAKVQGNIVGVASPVGVQAAADGLADNFVVDVKCGECEHVWLDGLKYQATTVVRCPVCSAYNRVDSSHVICV